MRWNKGQANDGYIGEKLSRMLVLCFITIFAAQMNLYLFNSSFSISLAAICLPTILYLFDNVAIIPFSLVAGLGIFGTRIVTHYIHFGNFDHIIRDYAPEILFYLTYAVMLCIYDYLINHKRKISVYVPGVIVIDYLSNVIELLSRMQLDSFNADSQLVLVALAFARGIILFFILWFMNKYKIIILSKAHAERYQKLIMLVSRLNGEIIWLEKGTSNVESTMSTSYNLYSRLQESGNKALALDALSVAESVHEIKKEYMLIIKGISEDLQDELGSNSMNMRDVFWILSESIRYEFRDIVKSIIINTDSENQLATKAPFLFLSVFHNLASNAVEASDKDECIITIYENKDGDHYIYTVTDNGPGIPTKYANQIFQPRFSTKINYETGEINRGLGLCIVKDIVERKLQGTVELAGRDSSATFIISIPSKEMEEIS